MLRRRLIAGVGMLGAGAAVLGRTAPEARAEAGAAGVCNARLTLTAPVSDRLYLIGVNGNQIRWGAYALTIPRTWMNIGNQGLAPLTLYYVYVWGNPNDGIPHLELSTVGHGPDDSWNECKLGDPSRLLLGMVFTDEQARFVKTPREALVLNWFNRRWIPVGPPAAQAIVTAHKPAWQNLGPISINDMKVLVWPWEGFDVQVNGFGAVSVDGGRVNMVIADLALGPEVPLSSWFGMTSSKAWEYQNVSAPSINGLSEGMHELTFFGHVDGPGTAYVYVNMAAKVHG